MISLKLVFRNTAKRMSKLIRHVDNMNVRPVSYLLLILAMFLQNQTGIKKDTLKESPDFKTVASSLPDSSSDKKVPEKTDFTNAHWVQQSGATSGHVYAFAFDSSNLYAVTYGGVFNSKDSGKTWRLVNAELSGDRSLGKIQAEGSNLYAMSNNINYCYGGNYSSKNGGKTWSGGGGSCRGCESSSRDEEFKKRDSIIQVGKTVFMGNSDGAFYRDENEKIWKPVRGGLINEINSEIFSLVSFCGDIYACSFNGVFVSRDNGKSWESFNSGLPEKHHIRNFAVKDTFLFAGGSSVFRRSKNERSWTAIAKEFPGAQEKVVVSNGNVIRVAAYNESESGEFWKTFLSANNGITWKEIAMNWPYADPAYNLMAGGSDVYLSVTDDYHVVLYHSKDSGKSWTMIEKEALQYYSALISDGNIIYGGRELECDGGACGAINIDYSSDKGHTWTSSDSGLPDDISVKCFANLGSVVFAGTFPKDSYTIMYDEAESDCSDGGIFYSKDKGKSWKSINKGLPPGIKITTLLVHKDELYAGTDFGTVFKLVTGK
ncbi:MAG TPA: sialidase family protein [Chitinispirillaceae bacterium]|nr:sialidase family protein [Chitinispirillaceae bacterium]